MSDRLSLSIFAIEVDGKPTLALEAKRYSEAEAICGDEGLRAKLSLLKSGDVPICGDNAILDVRLAPGCPGAADVRIVDFGFCF
jgi:hypothetical protein